MVKDTKRPDAPKDVPWHHLPNGRFRNPKGSPERGGRSLRIALPYFADMFRRSFEKIAVPASHLVDRAQAVKDLAVARATQLPHITWLGHASFLFQQSGYTVLTDPYLTSYAGPAGLGPKRFVKSGIPIADLPPIDVLVVSHNHYDHLDERALAKLSGKETMLVIVPLKLGAFFTERGFRNVVELDWYEHHDLPPKTTDPADEGLRVTALPVVHWSRRVGFDTNTTLWAGFGFKSSDHNLFFGGDSGYGDIFSEIGKAYGPFDTALIGIGAYDPRVMMAASHATPEEAVQIGLDLRARQLVGMHWGTVVLTSEPPFEPPERFLAAGAAQGIAPENLWIMKIGETRPLNGTWPANSI
ncbi:MAG: MBL fold metallo-hydrolase [Parvibaculaceae bacterium]|nr:MBL fold metallo-hydrolase [Parvibaculaceae bacterium]